MIEVEGLTKQYGNVLAVNNVSFRVDRGEILGFLGPNGAGKSTTMKILTCFMPANSGRATVAGFDVFTQSRRVREKVGYLIARVRHVAQDEGFAVNPKKTRVQRPESRQSVTGLVVNAAPAVPRDVVKRLRAILHRAKAEGLAAQNRDNHPNFRGWVEGMIAYVGMARPDVGRKLRAEFDAVDRSAEG